MRIPTSEQTCKTRQCEAYARDLEQTLAGTAWAMRGALDRLLGFANLSRTGVRPEHAAAWQAGYQGAKDLDRLTLERLSPGRLADYATLALAAAGLGPMVPTVDASPIQSRSGVYCRRNGVTIAASMLGER